MNTTTTHDAYELVIDTGVFSPADGDEEWMPLWIIKYGYLGAAKVDDGYLVVDVTNDQIYLARMTRNGVINAELKFSAPDDEVNNLDATAFRAVAEAWSK